MFRTIFSGRLPGGLVRKFHSSPVSGKSVTEAADKVNKKVGQGLTSAIEAGEKATKLAKESINSMGEQAKSKAKEAVKNAKVTTNKLADDANRVKRDAAGKMDK